MGCCVYHALCQNPGTITSKWCEGVLEAAASALRLTGGRIGVLACVGVAEVAGAGVGDVGGEDRYDRSVNVPVHHCDDVILDAVAIPLSLATHQHLGSDGIGVTSGELVLTVGLIEAAANAVDGDFPKLGLNSLQHLGIVDALDFGFEVSANFEMALNPLIPLLPDAAAAITGKASIPGVTVFVGTAKLIPEIAAGLNGGGGGHDAESTDATLLITA